MSVCEIGLVYRLKESERIQSIVGERIYPGLIDEREILTDGSMKASICYEVEDDEPVMCMAGSAGLSKAIVLLNCWGGCKHTDRTVAKQLQEMVRDSLNGFRGKMGMSGVRSIFLKDNGDLIYTAPGNLKLRAYGVQLEATIHYTETIPSLQGAT